MLKIGEFSKLSHLTVKALRFYERKGILIPKKVDEQTGYRFYETSQLKEAARIKSYRQLGLTIEELQATNKGINLKEILISKAESLKSQKEEIENRLLIIHHLLNASEMQYQVIEKVIPETIVYYSEVKIKNYSDMMKIIPNLASECIKLNPDIKCTRPPYEFCEYLDKEHKENNILIRHNEAVECMGKESERIKFKIIPTTKVLSIFYKGAYDEIGVAYSFLMKYVEDNGYQVSGRSRECYIDGIWNKESVDEWLTDPRNYDQIFKVYVACFAPEEQKLETLKELPWCRFHKEYLFVEPGDKSVGIKMMVDHFKGNYKDVVVFGDEKNDLSMFRDEWTSIAMGNAIDELKEKATYVTTPCDQDGIYNACVHFGWIKEND